MTTTQTPPFEQLAANAAEGRIRLVGVASANNPRLRYTDAKFYGFAPDPTMAAPMLTAFLSAPNPNAAIAPLVRGNDATSVRTWFVFDDSEAYASAMAHLAVFGLDRPVLSRVGGSLHILVL